MADSYMTFKDGTVVTDYLACAYAEGFGEGDGASDYDQLIAWAHLIKTGLCWKLQGFYGRTASGMIDAGVITRDGIINWSLLQ